MKQFLLELWLIISVVMILIFILIAIILPDFLWSVFYIGEVLIIGGFNFLLSIYLNVKK